MSQFLDLLELRMMDVVVTTGPIRCAKLLAPSPLGEGSGEGLCPSPEFF